MIINLTSSHHSDNVVEIMFQSINNDWFSVLFPASVDFTLMNKYYIGKDFSKVKNEYYGKVFAEADFT